MRLKRNVHSQRRRASVGFAAQRRVVYHLRVFSHDAKGRVLDMFSSGPAGLSLEKDGESQVISLETGELKWWALNWDSWSSVNRSLNG